MKFKANLICRGDGLINFHLKATSSSTFNNTIFTASTDKCDNIPVTAYPYNSKGSLINEVILTVPLLQFKKISISAKKNGEQYSIRFTNKTILAQSKLNYALNGTLARAIRNTSQTTPVNAIKIEPTSFSKIRETNPEQYLIKGIISIPQKTENLSLYFTDEHGLNPQDIPWVYIGEKTSNEILWSTFSFVFRFDVNRTGGCIVAENFNAQTAFLCLDESNLHITWGKYSTEGYSITSPANYFAFQSNAREQRRLFKQNVQICYEIAPLFSIITPLYNTPSSFLEEMLQSVFAQSYKKWELILINASPENEELTKKLNAITDSRVRIITLEKNYGIAENTNRGINQAEGDFICFFDHDDVLEPETLLRYWTFLHKHPDAEVLYCDEDILKESGEYDYPHFKPDFSIDLLRVHNYITHFLVVKAGLAKNNLLDSTYDGAQDYDFILRISEITDKIYHIPEVLYHWRASDTSTAKNSDNKKYAIEAGRHALEQHLKRCDLPADVSAGVAPFFYNVRYKIEKNPLVSIIIPNKDHVKTLNKCITSIQEKTTYSNCEIIIVENNSTEDATFKYYQEIEKKWDNVHIIFWPYQFNYSKINNFGAKSAGGDYLILLNNDTEVITPNWIENMLGYCQRSEVGVVGAKLLYPDNTVQHAGIKICECITPAESGGPVHIFSQIDKNEPGYMRRASIPQNVTAVTAACLMTKKSIFQDLGGLDEEFTVAYNDVDYCLRVQALGKSIVFNPDAELYHHESLSRGLDNEETGLKNYARFLSEQGLLRKKWSKVLALPDPYHRFG